MLLWLSIQSLGSIAALAIAFDDTTIPATWCVDPSVAGTARVLSQCFLYNATRYNATFNLTEA